MAKPYLADVYEVANGLVQKHKKLIAMRETFMKFHDIVLNDKKAICERFENGVRVLTWFSQHFPTVKADVPIEEEQDDRL